EAGKIAVPPPPPDAALPVVEPIIGDEEFNRAIPSLDVADDPELNRPLESIEAFERRIADEQARAQAGAGQPAEGQAAEGQAAPPGEPSLADGEATGEIGDAPIRDAALAKPL